MHSLLTFTWNMPKGLDLGFIHLRFYSLLFASGFVIGYFIMKRFFKQEGLSQEKLDSLVTYMVVSTIIGARLGHVFFYQWDYYSQNLLEILMVWEGGLASHGAAIAIVIALVMYSRKVLQKNPLYILDRVVVTVALAGALIRMGNFFNSEIYGSIGNSHWETVYLTPPTDRLESAFNPYLSSVSFAATGERHTTDSLDYPLYLMSFTTTDQVPNKATAERLVLENVMKYLKKLPVEDRNIWPHGESITWQTEQSGQIMVRGIPRSPTQVYEALGYFVIFLILYLLYERTSVKRRLGFLFGAFLVLVFGFRFAIEYAKEVQVAAEIGQELNIGQKLSIPLVLAGLYFMVNPKKQSS